MARKKIAIEGGHGGYKSLNPKAYATAGKRTPDGEPEWEFNNKVVLAAIAELNTYEDVEILRLDDPTGKTDVSLKARTDKANKWGADILISCHHNAHKGVWGTHTGTSTHVYLSKPQGSINLANLVQSEILKAYGLRDRGIVFQNLHMLRESKMTAILTEGGFMDSSIDIKKLRDAKVLEAAGKGIATGAAKYLKLKKKPVKVTPPKVEAPKAPSGAYTVHTNINGYVTAASAKSRTKAASKVKPGSYHIYKQADGMFNVTTKAGVPGSWINPGDNKAPAQPAAPKTFLIKVKVSELWYYDRPNWNAKKAIVRKNEVFTVVETLTVNGSKMYKLKSGNYITANTLYVEVIK